MAILAASSLAGPFSTAIANPILLENVTFADGGTAVGSFGLTVYGYIDGESISTTAGTALSGDTYTSGLLGNPPPPATQFDFNAPDGFSLALEVASALGADSSNYDPLVAGSVNGAVVSGSYEACTQSSCGGTGVYRLIESGTTYAPEPSAPSLLAFGLTAFACARRLRTGRHGSAA
jgi:hypothetical protein